MLSTPHPAPPILPGFRQCKWKWKPYAINPPSLFLINIHPLLSPPATAEKSLCIPPYKLRLGFILTENLYVTDDRPRQFLVFFNENDVVPTLKCVLFNVIVNSYDTRPTAPGFRIFFQLKRASRKPFQIPCVFSMKVCLAFKVIVNLYVMRSIAPTFLVFSRRKCASQESLGSLTWCFLR